MKLRLKISKQLKRQLKISAGEIERTDYVLDILKNYVSEHKPVNENDIASYKQFLEEREQGLMDLQAAQDQDEETSIDEKRKVLKAYYEAHHMYRTFYSNKRKYENLTLHMDEALYYPLMMLADEHKTTLENFVENLIHHLE